MPQVADRIKNLPTYIFAEIGENLRRLQADNADIIRLDIGNPDLPPDDTIINELSKSAKMPTNHGYSGYRGITNYREAVASFYDKRFSVAIDPEAEILPLIGTKEGIANLTLAYIDSGDVSLVPSLGYPSYAMATRLAGGKVVYIPMDDNYLLDITSLPAHELEKAKLLWVNYPNNPTGATASLDFYGELLEVCKRYDILLVSDNPYVDITFDDYHAPSLLELPSAKDHAMELFSFSKTYNMAGWRIGAAVGNEVALRHLLKVKSNVDSGHFKAIYLSASKALDTISEDWITKRNQIYQRRRDILFESLADIGMSAKLPKATLYIWAKIPDAFDSDDATFVNQVLNNAHISLAPGSAYGPAGKGYVRLSVSIPDERLKEAISRLKNWYKHV